MYYYCTLHISHSSHSQQFGSQRKYKSAVLTSSTAIVIGGASSSVLAGKEGTNSVETTEIVTAKAVNTPTSSIVMTDLTAAASVTATVCASSNNAEMVVVNPVYSSNSATVGSPVLRNETECETSSSSCLASLTAVVSINPMINAERCTSSINAPLYSIGGPDKADSHHIIETKWSLETIDTYLQDNKLTMGCLLKLHDTIQATITSEKRKDDRSRDYYGRLFSALNYASYGRHLVELNNIIYRFTTVPDYGSVDFTVVKNPLSKLSVRESYLQQFCQACIERFAVPN